LRADALRTTAQVGHQEDPIWIRAIGEQMGDSVRKRVRLARASTRDEQQRACKQDGTVDAVLNGTPLLRV
jgi:hypothetical protein